VENGFAQHPSIGYDEKYALVARLNTIRIILSLKTQYKWLVYEIYFKSYFKRR
jgi:hypothetical protein